MGNIARLITSIKQITVGLASHLTIGIASDLFLLSDFATDVVQIHLLFLLLLLLLLPPLLLQCFPIAVVIVEVILLFDVAVSVAASVAA